MNERLNDLCAGMAEAGCGQSAIENAARLMAAG